MKKFGLIGKSLTHSFSKKYFEDKFKKLNLFNHTYDLIELQNLNAVKKHIFENDYIGLNVTIPYKEEIMSHLDFISEEAKIIGAVNTIKVENGMLKGYNSDYYGFQNSLLNFIPHNKIKALIFGTGGASKAVAKALDDLNILYLKVSRIKKDKSITYSEVNSELISKHKLLINTTPLGTYPEIDQCIEIDYEGVSENHFCYDLIYNPKETKFLNNCFYKGAKIKNGIEMLELQAEKAWETWIR